MKSDKEVNEQVDEENQTQEGRAKKGTSNDKNYISRCTDVGLNKIFAALPEEEKRVLCTTCFAPLLLIDPITMMSTLVVEIFDRHLGDMKFQFGETIIMMKPIHVCLILGLCVSPIANEFLFVDPEHITNFRMRQKLERLHYDILRLNLLKIILSFLLPNKRRNVGVKYVDLVDDLHQFNRFPWAMKPSETDMQQELVQETMRNHIEAPEIGTAPAIEPPTVSAPAVGAPVIGSSSSTIEIGVVVVRYQFSTPKKTVKRKREEGNEKEDRKRKKAKPRTWQRDL
ncbi:hypothetical protein GIB67_021528 [Kingdonia uniflora]|uniref:Uncharacterized protein n=1 Tax=Kingdonia uniflora TaxID=39325 RepID=A0A7J7L9U8_9MAGN|nr:hypothetical protein GIB67_021528 [Kingdonia uniflora]